MMACFDNARVQVQIRNILVSGGVTKEDAGEIMTVEFAPSGTGAFDADTRAKSLKVCDIRLTAVPTFVGSLVS